MRFLKGVVPLLCLALLAAMPFATARADESNKLTIFTFSGPVELPGVSLPAGTYAFKVMDSGGDRNIVQVFNKDRTKLYATILAIPDYRPDASDKTIVRFSETSPGVAAPIKEWFYPGDNFGLEFVYPKTRAEELAKATNKPVPSMPDNLKSDITESAKSETAPSVTAMKNAPLKAEQPSGGEVTIFEVFATQPTQQSNENAKHHVNTEASN